MLSQFPIVLACNFILTIPFSVATAVPYSTTFANSTKITFPSAAGTTGCPSNCTRNNGPLGSITWTARTITATITAETIVHVVNKKNNSTRIETITNTEVDLKGYTPLPTTKTTSVVLPFGTTSRTEILTFPSILYSDYPSSYTFCGTLPTVTAGVSTCLRYPCGEDTFNSDSPVFAYPSHPLIPDTIQNISASYLALDPRGSTYDAVWSYDSDYDSLIEPLIDMGAWNCEPFGAWAAPASVLNTALYLTATSTSTEAGDEAGATPAAKASPPKKAPAPAAGKKPAKVEPPAVEASQIFANPFEVASNPAPKKANSNGGTSPNQGANDDTPTHNAPAVNHASPHYGSSNVQEGNSNNNAALLPVSGLNNQVATAIPAPAANAIANVIISSTNAQGSIMIATSQLPGVIVTTTNAQGSQVTTTIPVVSPPVLDTAQSPAPVVVNGHTLTTDSQSHYILAGQTLAANTPLILGSGASSTPVLLQTTGIHPVLVIGSSTTTLTQPTPTTLTPTPTTPPAITIGTQPITPNAQGQYIVGSQTLTRGGEIVVGGTTASGGTVAVGGTTVSLAASATQVVVGTSTEGLAPYIVGGFGTGPNNNSNGTGTVAFLGGAGERVGCWGSGWRWRWLVGVAGVVWVVL